MIRCFICNKTEESAENPLISDVPMHPELQIHEDCYASTAFKEWVAKQKEADPTFVRYWELMTARLPVSCPSCQATMLRVPKAIGMAAGSWEACCEECDNVCARGLSGYAYPEVYRRLAELRERFSASQDGESISQEVASLAQEADKYLARLKCECGGNFSLAAFPRCPQCRHIVIRSPFHLVYIPE